MHVIGVEVEGATNESCHGCWLNYFLGNFGDTGYHDPRCYILVYWNVPIIRENRVLGSFIYLSLHKTAESSV